MTRMVALLSCVVIMGMLTLDSAGQEKKKDAGKKHEVIMVDDKFKPDKITVEVGDSIVWVNKGNKTHTASSDEGVPKDLEFDTEDVDGGKMSKAIKFAKEGKIPYNCIHHAGMKGEVIVKAKGKK